MSHVDLKQCSALAKRISGYLRQFTGALLLVAVTVGTGCSKTTGKYEEPEGGYKQIEPAGKSGSLPRGLKLKSVKGGQEFRGKSNTTGKTTNKTSEPD